MSSGVTVTTRLEFGELTYIFQGTPDDDEINGFNGQRNRLFGDDGDDVLRIGKNAILSSLQGEAGNDTLYGGLTGDSLSGGIGADSMVGGEGDDIYFVDDVGDVVVEKMRWSNTSFGDLVQSSVDFSIFNTAVERLVITGAARSATGNKLDNEIVGNNGDNILDGGRGVDTLRGGNGDDTYILRHKDDTAVEVGGNARQKTLRADEGGHDTVLAHNSYKLMLGIEDIVLQDVLGKSGQAVNGLTAIGNNLDNLVVGNATDNSLNGRTGNDTLTGGGGADDFIFTDTFGAQHADLITDYASGEDRVVIKGALVNVGAGVLDDAAFHLGDTAQTAEHRFLFDGTTLRYDADGSGAGAAADVAVFEGSPTLTADDIFIT